MERIKFVKEMVVKKLLRTVVLIKSESMEMKKRHISGQNTRNFKILE